MKKDHGLDAKSFNKLLYISFGVVIFLTLGISAFLVYFLNNLSEQISKNKYTSINNNKKVEALTNLEKDYKSMKSESDMLDAYLPEQKEVSSILKDLENMAGKNGLSFSSYQVGGTVTKTTNTTTAKVNTGDVQIQNIGGNTVFPFKIVVKGSFAKIDAMIKDIEAYSRLTEIKEIKYNKDTTAPGDIVEASLTVNAYLKK